MMNRKLLTGAGLLLVVLAACDGSDGTMGNPQDQFGNFFRAAFNQGPNAVPKDDPELVIVYQGVTGVDPTAGPIDL